MSSPGCKINRSRLGLNQQPFVRDGNDKKLYKNLTVLSDRIILKIESLFETECQDCNAKYTNRLEDNPLLTCHLCLQGSHNCDAAKKNAAALADLREAVPTAGVIWLCSGCFKKNDLALAPKKQAPSDQSVSGETTQTGEDLRPRENGNERNEEHEEDRVSPRRSRLEESKEDPSGPICDAYKKRQCPHGPSGKFLVNGKTCQNAHPRRCFRYCNHGKHPKQGCTKGKQCQYWHPRLCKFSTKNRSCSNEDCTFYHLKGTRRPKKAAQPPEQEKVRPKAPNNNPDTEARKMMKFDSIASLNSIYPPTVNRIRNDSLKTESNFLLRHIENLKEGIINQMTEKITELQASLPSLIQEQINNRNVNVSRPSTPAQHYHMQGPVPFAPQIFAHNPMLAHFQQSSY
ncbi:hypothetical protein ACHWQZ_G016810 [Mnemiopsis leidyi]